MLKRIPIRWRLAVAFAVSMAALLVALGALVYFRVDDALRRSVDQALQAQSAEALAHPDAGSLLDADARQSGMVAQVVAADGRIVRSDPASLSGLTHPRPWRRHGAAMFARRSPSAPANGTVGARWPFPTARKCSWSHARSDRRRRRSAMCFAG